jgi:polyisoprenoid-binding protein YceI
MQTSEISVLTKWVIDPLHSEIGFKVKHLMFTNVKGTFKEYNASIYITNDDFTTAEIDIWINPASIYTHNEQRDAHLRSPDFFDVEKFKEISFTGNTLIRLDEKEDYELFGELTMKGIKKQVKLNVEMAGIIKDQFGTEKALFSIHGKINRKDWELNWNAALETGGVLVSDEVWINCEVQLIKQPS